MRIGQMQERVTIQRASVTRNPFNEEIVTWSNVTTVWAQVTERGGREPLLADRPVMIVSYEITIRSGVTVTHKDRLLWRGKALSIETVTPKQAEGLIVMRGFEAEL